MPRVFLLVPRAILPLVLALTGCAALGPQRVGIDRGDYTQRLRESEKAQLLANIVALRHGDAPMFLNVTSVISQYTRETSGTLGLTVAPASGSDGGDTRGSVLLRETPTVTYTPITGERFAHSMLAPMPPISILAMIEAGWASDDLLRITVRSINGVANPSHSQLFEQPADSSFDQVVRAFRQLQQSGAVNYRMTKSDKAYTGIARLAPVLSAEDRASLALLEKALGLKFDGGGGVIVFAAQRSNDGEIAIMTRSMLEVLGELSHGVDMSGSEVFPSDALIRVHSGAKAPPRTHVAVKYQDRWFWIADDDDASKRMFLLAQVLLFLNDEEGASRAPLVTIPAG